MCLTRMYKTMTNIAKHLVLFVLFLTWAMSANAAGIIRDDEIEDIIKEIVAPILRSAGLDPKRMELYIIGDDAVNAFTAGGHTIFVYQGLIKLSRTPDALAGIMAHEIGHIALGHVAREDDKINDALDPIRSISLGILSGIVAVLAKSPAMLSMSLAAPGHDYLQYTRIQESSADNMAVQIMRKADISIDGLISAMSYFKEKEKMMLVNTRSDYNRTHPFSKDRLDFLEHEKGRAPAGARVGTDEQRKRFATVVDKLKAYTDPISSVTTTYGNKDTFNARYAMAIVSIREGSWDKALSITNSLIAEIPDNPYLLELRSSILYASGKADEATVDLEKACAMLGNNMSTMKLKLIHKKLSYGSSDKYRKSVIGDLEYETMLSTHNLAARYTLANAYNANEQYGMSHITLGNLYLVVGDILQASRHLGIAKQFSKNEQGLEKLIKELESGIEIALKKSSII